MHVIVWADKKYVKVRINFRAKTSLIFDGNGFAFVSKMTKDKLLESCCESEIFVLQLIGKIILVYLSMWYV